MVKKVKEALEAVGGVLTTVDVWTANHQNYLGMIFHWIDKDTLKRCKLQLLVWELERPHLHCHGLQIEHTHVVYGLNGKVIGTITDNASNFVKAFSVYSVSSPEHSKATVPGD